MCTSSWLSEPWFRNNSAPQWQWFLAIGAGHMFQLCHIVQQIVLWHRHANLPNSTNGLSADARSVAPYWSEVHMYSAAGNTPGEEPGCLTSRRQPTPSLVLTRLRRPRLGCTVASTTCKAYVRPWTCATMINGVAWIWLPSKIHPHSVTNGIRRTRLESSFMLPIVTKCLFTSAFLTLCLFDRSFKSLVNWLSGKDFPKVLMIGCFCFPADLMLQGCFLVLHQSRMAKRWRWLRATLVWFLPLRAGACRPVWPAPWRACR